MSTKLALGLTLLAMVAPAVAMAQVDQTQLQQARARFEAGEAAYAANDYEGALRAFEEAHGMMEGHPNQGMILFNIARSQDELGRGQAAVESYRRFLEEAPADAPNRTTALERITLLQSRGGSATAEVEPAATGDTATASTTGRTTGGGGPHPIGPILIAVGGAALIAGAIVGGVGLAERDSVLSRCDGMTCPSDVEAQAADLETLGIVTDALLWPGLAIAAAGVVLTFVLTEDGADTAVACGPMGCSVSGTF